MKRLLIISMILLLFAGVVYANYIDRVSVGGVVLPADGKVTIEITKVGAGEISADGKGWDISGIKAGEVVDVEFTITNNDASYGGVRVNLDVVTPEGNPGAMWTLKHKQHQTIPYGRSVVVLADVVFEEGNHKPISIELTIYAGWVQ